MSSGGGSKGKSVKDEEQGTPSIRKFRAIDSNRRKTESAEKDKASAVGGVNSEAKRNGGKQTEDGFEIRGYELRTPPSTHALRRLSMDVEVPREVSKSLEKSHSMRSKVQDEVMKLLFGPPDALTPDEEKYELVEEEEVARGVGRTGILFRFSMWATFSFITWVFAGRRVQVGCSEFTPNVSERDPVPKVIIRRQKQVL